MQVSEQDLELLEMLLDGELSAEQAEALRLKLAAEPVLAQAMDRLRSERGLRQRIWQGLEPGDAEVARLVAGIRRDINRQQLWTRRARALRYVSGLAACILVGFVFGRFVPIGSPTAQVDRGGGVVFETPAGQVQEVMDTGPGPRPRPGEFKVLLTDSLGRVIAEQRFSTLDEAREFTNDLNRLQSPTRPMRVSDTIFKKDQF